MNTRSPDKTGLGFEERTANADELQQLEQQQRKGEVVLPGANGGAATPLTAAWDTSSTVVANRRDDALVLMKIKAAASAAGERWFYRFPVKSKGQTKWIEGANIKLANAVARIYGNCDIDFRAFNSFDERGTQTGWLFYARFYDRETGFSMIRAFEQSVTGAKLGGDDDTRRREISFQIGQSKAIRNVICNCLGDLTDYGFDIAKANLVERIGKNIEGSRQRIVDKLTDIGVEVSRVERHVGKPAKDWMAGDVARVLAEVQAVDDGMSSADDIWPDEQSQGEGGYQPKPVVTADKKTSGVIYSLVSDDGEFLAEYTYPEVYLENLCAMLKDPEKDCEALWSANDESLTKIKRLRKQAVKDALAECQAAYESARSGDAPVGAQTGSGESEAHPTPAADLNDVPASTDADGLAATKASLEAGADAALQQTGMITAGTDAVLVKEEPIDRRAWTNTQWIDASNDLLQKVLDSKTDSELSDIEATSGEFLEALKGNSRANSAKIIVKNMNEQREKLAG